MANNLYAKKKICNLSLCLLSVYNIHFFLLSILLRYGATIYTEKEVYIYYYGNYARKQTYRTLLPK